MSAITKQFIKRSDGIIDYGKPYDQVFPMNSTLGLQGVRNGSQIGYADEDGKIIIPIEYLCPKENGQYKEPQWQLISGVSQMLEEKAQVSEKQTSAPNKLTESGIARKAIASSEHDHNLLRNYLTVLFKKENGACGVINALGEEILPFEYSNVKLGSFPFAAVAFEREDHTFFWRIYNYRDKRYTSNLRAFVQFVDGKYSICSNFSERYGVMENESGKILIPEQYCSINIISDVVIATIANAGKYQYSEHYRRSVYNEEQTEHLWLLTQTGGAILLPWYYQEITFNKETGIIEGYIYSYRHDVLEIRRTSNYILVRILFTGEYVSENECEKFWAWNNDGEIIPVTEEMKNEFEG